MPEITAEQAKAIETLINQALAKDPNAAKKLSRDILGLFGVVSSEEAHIAQRARAAITPEMREYCLQWGKDPLEFAKAWAQRYPNKRFTVSASR
jgi:hypothetical protein